MVFINIAPESPALWAGFFIFLKKWVPIQHRREELLKYSVSPEEIPFSPHSCFSGILVIF
jgi:hypothetical protein